MVDVELGSKYTSVPPRTSVPPLIEPPRKIFQSFTEQLEHTYENS